MTWTVEQVEAIAPSAAAVTAARPLAVTGRWRSTGADDRVVWGSCQGSGAEPYDTVVDHEAVRSRCTCPSRRTPCKHALALLLMWTRDEVPPATPPPPIETWMTRHRRATGTGATGRGSGGEADRDAVSGSGADGPGDDPADEPVPDGDAEGPTGAGAANGTGSGPGVDGSGGNTASDRAPSTTSGGIAEGDSDDPPAPPDDVERDSARDERVERMHAGLTELDRWLGDRMRTGLADPALARYATWDDLAARLVDARAGSLANRIRRLAGLVGASPDWHDDVLAELGLLHLLAQAGRRLGSLPGPLADAVATTVGWQVRTADVLGNVPDTDRWVVAGRSDQREDRIEVRRSWLRGVTSGRWALVLSFAAYRQSLDTSLTVGTEIHADLHRYPGPALRALVGERHRPPEATMFPGERIVEPPGRPPSGSVAAACEGIGRMLVAEPWLDRLPSTVTASVAQDHGRWFLTDGTGSLPLLADAGPSGSGDPLAMLLALSGGGSVDVTVEWTPHGVTPLTVHLDDRSIDIGPRADASFVGAA
ncbi:SWIM zinc finger family protein [Ilumatobacter sp.]|uniref:SWIM zinc finger family protein n=1 Tax=Ilumatobacter sp. TaxID=1967498 RepID=UPI003B5228C7